MSVEVISWALNNAPVDESSAAFVLVGLANHASPDGRGAFPSVARLVSYTQLGERTVREQLDLLEAAGIITPCDPAIIAAWIKRSDRRPQGWDIDMSLDRKNPEHRARFQAAVSALKAQRKARRTQLSQKRGVQSSHPDNEVQPSHPDTERGATVAGNGVRPSQERGATVAPEPYLEPSNEPSKDQNPASPLAVGADTARTERDAVTTPPATSQDFSRLAGDVLGKLPAHYRDAPAWLRSRMLTRIEEALHAGNAPAAVIAYAAKFAADPNFGAYEHLRQFADAVRKLTVDVSEGITCPGCGLDSRHPFCTANVAGGF
ncbi:helix-turn-helix domain-containing protein [Streptosporangium subroseum]|uniref:helix-turn-helix domain-containing protein n=1 Tax=Streptosporangium subroseum TaxID=106412 RepID=UPI0030907FFB|nr:helix-turn-helix domain-containing protein [Streptosporangium subroseum]